MTRIGITLSAWVSDSPIWIPLPCSRKCRRSNERYSCSTWTVIIISSIKHRLRESRQVIWKSIWTKTMQLVKQERMQKLKLYYLHIDFGIKPFVQGLFDGGVQNWYLKQTQSTWPGKDKRSCPGPRTRNTCHINCYKQNNVHNCHNWCNEKWVI